MKGIYFEGDLSSVRVLVDCIGLRLNRLKLCKSKGDSRKQGELEISFQESDLCVCFGIAHQGIIVHLFEIGDDLYDFEEMEILSDDPTFEILRGKVLTGVCFELRHQPSGPKADASVDGVLLSFEDFVLRFCIYGGQEACDWVNLLPKEHGLQTINVDALEKLAVNYFASG